MFWRQRRGTASRQTDGATARDLEPALEPIQLFLEETVVLAEIDPEGERVTDLLADHSVLRVRLEDGTWDSYLAESIVLVGPPPHRSQRKIHRAKRRVEFDAGAYTIIGTAHLSPGTQLDPFVLRSGRRFLPVTDAWVQSADGEVSQDLEVVIVAVDRISSARELLGPA